MLHCNLSLTCGMVIGLLQTWYVVDYNLSGEDSITAPVPGDQLSSKSSKCAGYQLGITYSFCLAVTPVSPHCSVPRPHRLAYRVTADPNTWVLSGKTTGRSLKPSQAKLWIGVLGLLGQNYRWEIVAFSGKTAGRSLKPSRAKPQVGVWRPLGQNHR